MANNSVNETNRYSLGIYISIAFGNFVTEFFLAAFGTRVFDYFENEVGLKSIWISSSFIIYAVYNMFNDPIVGHISDKPRKWWTRKGWGKRRPWILGAIPLMGIAFILMFAVPQWDSENDALWLMLWLLISSILYDTAFSIFGTNFFSLLSEKFRTDKERRRQATTGMIASTFGTVLGVIVPSIVGRYSNQYSWLLAAVVVAIVGVGLGMFIAPGTKEPPDMIEREEHCVEEKIHDENEHCEEEKYPFLATLKVSLKDKNYVAYLILIVCYQCLTLLMVGSIPYLNRFVIQPGPVEPEYKLFITPIICSLLSIPIWNWITRKIGNRKTIVIGGILIVCAGFPFLFISNEITVIFLISFMGVAQIAFGMQFTPILSDIVDELVAKIGKRREGLIIGVRTFFARLGLIIQAITFFFIHTFTGYDPGELSQTPLAIWGLRIQLAVVPTIIMAIGVFIFWRLYDIDRNKKKVTRKILSEQHL